MAPRTLQTPVTLRVADDKVPGPDRTIRLELEGAVGARLEPSPQSLTFTVRDDDALAGRVLVVLVQTLEMEEDAIGGRVRAELAQLLAGLKGRGVLLREGFVVVRKEAATVVWTPDRPPPQEGRPFTSADSLDAILNAAFDQARTLRPLAAVKNFLVVVLWPNRELADRFALDATAIRRPEGQPVRLFALGTPSYRAEKLFEALPGRGEVKILWKDQQLADLQEELEKLIDMTFPSPKE